MSDENLENKLKIDNFFKRNIPPLNLSMEVEDSVDGIPLDDLLYESNGLKITSSVDGIPTDSIHGRSLRELGYESNQEVNLLKRYWAKVIQYFS